MLPHSKAGRSFTVDGASVEVLADKRTLGAAAAAQTADFIAQAIARRGRAAIMVATGNSQLEMMAALVGRRDVEWSKVTAFHLDEYVGLTPDHPASLRHWIRRQFEEKARPGAMHYIKAEAPDLDAELRRYAALFLSTPVDVAFVGIGENGHIAFNDPHVADFADPLLFKRMSPDDAARRQQVGEGHFPSIAAMPSEAVTVTCTGLMRVAHWICCVPDTRKANAVQASLEGPVTAACPGSLVRRHPSAFVYLDSNSATLLRSGSTGGPMGGTLTNHDTKQPDSITR